MKDANWLLPAEHAKHINLVDLQGVHLAIQRWASVLDLVTGFTCDIDGYQAP